MKQNEFLQSFKDLQSEVREIKTTQQRVLLHLENNKSFHTETYPLLEERVSVKEACRITGYSEVTLWKLRKDGTLPYIRINRSIRFKKIDILNYLNQKG